MVSIDSFLAGSMKLQVLTTRTSASIGMRRQLVAASGELAHHDFTVDEIFGTAETYKTDFQKDSFGGNGLQVPVRNLRLSGYHLATYNPLRHSAVPHMIHSSRADTHHR